MTPEELTFAARTCEEDRCTHVVCRDTQWMLTPEQVRALAKFAASPPWTFTESMNTLDTICTFCNAHRPAHHLDCPYAFLLTEFGIDTQLTRRAS